MWLSNLSWTGTAAVTAVSPAVASSALAVLIPPVSHAVFECDISTVTAVGSVGVVVARGVMAPIDCRCCERVRFVLYR